MRHVLHQQSVRRLLLTLPVVCVVALFTTGVFAQTATFGRTDYPLLGNRNVVGDFNGDAKPDLAGAGGNSPASCSATATGRSAKG